MAQGQRDEEISHYQEAIRLKPDYAEPHNNLGGALAEKGQLDEARSEFQEALRLNPDYVLAHNNLGLALAGQARYAEAAAAFREVLRLKPDDPDAQRQKLERALAAQQQLDTGLRALPAGVADQPR